MKLYTEEQVNELRRALRDIAKWDDNLEEDWGDPGYRAIDALKCFDKVTPIELPSEDEIKHYFSKTNNTPWDIAAINGALVIVEQIKKGRFFKQPKGGKR